MQAYLIPIRTALIVFPILAVLLTMPYILIQYRRYGATLGIRVMIVFSFIFYLLCCYFLISLPLPPIEEVAHYENATMQLIPFATLREISLTTSFVWNDPSTYLVAFNEPSVLQVVFNIIMTIPFGMYLRYYFRCSLRKSFVLTFLLTLSFELLQLSGLFFIYPRPYRLFDVDDLMTNTLGGVIGYGITPLIAHFLPSRKTLDEESFAKGTHVSFARRLFAFMFDFIFLMGSYVCYLFLSNTSKYDYLIYLVMLLIFFLIIPLLSKGKTLGKRIVKIRLVSMQESTATWYQYSIHLFLLWVLIVPAPMYVIVFMIQCSATKAPALYAWYLLCSCYIVYLCCYSKQVMGSYLHPDKPHMITFIDRIKNISTVVLPNTQEEEDTHEEKAEEKQMIFEQDQSVDENFTSL